MNHEADFRVKPGDKMSLKLLFRKKMVFASVIILSATPFFFVLIDISCQRQQEN
jgi:hypothetical protein